MAYTLHLNSLRPSTWDFWIPKASSQLLIYDHAVVTFIFWTHSHSRILYILRKTYIWQQKDMGISKPLRLTSIYFCNCTYHTRGVGLPCSQFGPEYPSGHRQIYPTALLALTHWAPFWHGLGVCSQGAGKTNKKQIPVRNLWYKNIHNALQRWWTELAIIWFAWNPSVFTESHKHQIIVPLMNRKIEN